MGHPGAVHVLLVEDDKIDQEAFSRLVTRENLPYDYVIADSVMAAQACLELQPFDIILADYHLPDGTGIDVLRMAPPAVPVVLITGTGSEPIVVEALRAGAANYVFKDPGRTYLKLLPIIVERALDGRNMERELFTLSHAVRSSGESIFITDLDDHITFVNQAFQKTYGYTEREIIGQQCRAILLGPGAVPTPIDESEQEVTHLRKNGEPFPVLISRSTVFNEAGEPICKVIIARDMTERNSAVRALQDSEEKYRSVVAAMREGVVLHDQNGLIRTCNASAERILGLTASQIMGRTPMDPRWRSVHEDGSPFLGAEHPANVTLRTGEPCYGVVMGVHKPDGALTWIVINTEPLRIPGEDLPHAVVVSFTDITELKNTINERNALIKSLSAFAHTVAHDLKNPVTLINGYASLLISGEGEFSQEEITRYLKIIEATGFKVNRIIDALLLLASTREMTDIPVTALDMGQLVSESLDRLQSLIDETHGQIEITGPLPSAIGYAPWVEEVWVNYISNALKYGGDRPHVRIGVETPDQPDLSPIEPPQVVYYVEDDGPGLTPQEQDRLFNAYQRLAAGNVEGHGLGLSIVRDIVERLSGQVGVRSVVGRGSRFLFSLPARENNRPLPSSDRDDRGSGERPEEARTVSQ